ncbi:CehA/McbA family metallohydrolase [Algibacter sp. 2305UL17-15]|uniref:CehA/McbA family metallohydrolase n=1 Tax=Algibacter sp. 2305UL17-15 TaxID=3231268 RepID=UPI00345AA368
MKNLIVISIVLLTTFSAMAQWKNRYPKVDGYGHHVYLEGYELPVLNAGAMDPAPSPHNNQVVFSAKGWLWLMDFETSEAHRITTSSGMDSRPNWSQNGEQIVFIRDNSLDTQIVLLDLQSKKETVLVDTEALELDPIFSSSGEFVYYSSAKNASFDLWKINLSTLETSLITKNSSLERLPVPTLQEDKIVYLKKTGFSYDSIELFDVKQNISSPLAEENFMSQAAFALSPDNQTLVYTWPNGDDYELRLLNISIPKSRMLLTKSEGLPLAPKFSSDGKWVYYAENNTNEISELKRISINGGLPETLKVNKWDYGVETGKLKIVSKVDGKIDAVRLSITDKNGHPIIPNKGIIHSEGQNGIVFFYASGEVEIEAPLGEVTITAVHGFATPKHVQSVEIKQGSTTTELNLNKNWDAKKDGWYSADNHFHLNYGGTSQLDPEDILVDLKAEDIDIAYALVANLGNRFLEQDLINWKSDETPMLRFGQEVRSHFLGHLNLIGIKALYWPWVWGPYYDIYGTDDRLNAEPLRFTREQGGVSGYVHPVSIKDPFKEGGARSIPVSLIADAVLGEVDILELGCLWTDEIGTSALWHEFLNLGIPMALSAGSDVMNDLYRTMAIGAARVYVKPEGTFTEQSFLDALKKGKSFVSNGPQVLFTVNNKEVGDVVKSNKTKAQWLLKVHAPIPYETIEIFVNGKVVWTKKSKGRTSETYKGSITIPEGGWVTARVSGGKVDWPMMDSYPFAESSPIWFHKIGSTSEISRIEAATKLLKALEVSENRLKGGYKNQQIPKLSAHFSKAKKVLIELSGDNNN